jgi:hypothetical protein
MPDRAAHLRQAIAQQPEHEAIGDVAQLAHVAGPATITTPAPGVRLTHR